MYGYIFETTNTKTGDKYIGKRYAVSFDKHYFGEDANDALAVAIEKYGRPSFEVKMLMPFESQAAIDEVFNEMVKSEKKQVKKEEPKTEEPVEEKKPAKRGRKKVEE